MPLYIWDGPVINNFSEIKTTPGTMYHFSSGYSGMGGVPTEDVYVINNTDGLLTSLYKLDDVELDATGKPILDGSIVRRKSGIPPPPRTIYLGGLFASRAGPVHKVKIKDSLWGGGRKNKKSHKKSQKKSNKKNKTTRNKRK
jgi:hypothetical protein